MGRSKIEWTDFTFNPWVGCTKVSDGCKFCYAEEMMDHRFSAVEWGPNGKRKKTTPANWRKPIAWDKQAAAEETRYKVFCASLADVFEDNIDVYDWGLELFELIEKTPNLDWLLLTKRPKKVLELVPASWYYFDDPSSKFPDNVWIGTSVEDQATAKSRITELLQIPAKIRFLSCEPLLGSVDLDVPRIGRDSFLRTGLIDWVIVGGESGPNARPMHPDWARSLRDQCVNANVPFFFKQWGQWAIWDKNPEDVVAADIHYWGENMPDPMIKMNKKEAGHLLNGKVWHQFPEVKL